MNGSRLSVPVSGGGRVLLSAAIILQFFAALSISGVDMPVQSGEAWIDEEHICVLVQGTEIGQFKPGPLSPASDHAYGGEAPADLPAVAHTLSGPRAFPSLPLLLVASQAASADL